MVAGMTPAAPPDGSYLLCSDSGTGGVGLGGGGVVWRPPVK